MKSMKNNCRNVKGAPQRCKRSTAVTCEKQCTNKKTKSQCEAK
jgi:hypothetical protein